MPPARRSFFFQPQKLWYLVFQTVHGQLSAGLQDDQDARLPQVWGPTKPLVKKFEKAKWIDFYVICDETTAYLFYTRAHAEVWSMHTPLVHFPEGFADPQRAYGLVHEAVRIYKPLVVASTT